MSDTAYITAKEFGARLGKSEEWVASRARTGKFPHLRIGKSIRFTAEHVAAVEQLLTVAPTPTPAETAATSWGRAGRA